MGEMALGGAFWGFLFGLIFFVPLLGAGAAGAMSTSMEEGGIDEEFIKRVGEEVREGTSALFVLTSGAEDPERVAEEMKDTYDFEIIWTNLPDEQLEKLREVFAS